MFRTRSLFAGFVCTLVVAVTAVTAVTTLASCIQLKTPMDNFIVEVHPDKVLRTIANFLQYVKDGFYEGTIFHRVMDGFVIQGGGSTPDTEQKGMRPPVETELKNGLKNDKYTIATAHATDSNLAAVQFYVNVINSNMLNYPGQDSYGYTVFGKVAGGTDTIGEVKAVETTTKLSYQNVPMKPIMVEPATIVSK